MYKQSMKRSQDNETSDPHHFSLTVVSDHHLKKIYYSCNKMDTCSWARWRFRGYGFLWLFPVQVTVLILSQHVFISPCTWILQRFQMQMFGKIVLCLSLYTNLQSLIHTLSQVLLRFQINQTFFLFIVGGSSAREQWPVVKQAHWTLMKTPERASQKPALHRKSTLCTHDDTEKYHSIYASFKDILLVISDWLHL